MPRKRYKPEEICCQRFTALGLFAREQYCEPRPERRPGATATDLVHHSKAGRSCPLWVKSRHEALKL
jgi:hypothetical protein